MRSARQTPWPGKISTLLFWPWSKHDYTSCATSSILQERYCKSIAHAPKNTVINTSTQHKNTVQVWATTMHYRMAIQTQPWVKQRWRHYRHVHYHQCNRVMHWHTRLYDSRENKDSNTRWWAYRLTIEQSWGTEGTEAIMVIHWWDHNHRLHCNERQRNNNTDRTAKKALKHLQLNHMGIEMARLLLHESIYWINTNADIEEMLKTTTHLPWFPGSMNKDKTISHKIPRRPWESVEADIFTINNKYYLCDVDYHSIIPFVKQLEGLSTDKLIKTCKIIFFSEYRFPCIIVSDMGTNFI